MNTMMTFVLILIQFPLGDSVEPHMSEVFNIWYSLEDCKAWGTHVTESEKYMGYYCVEGTPDEETKGEDSPKEDDDVST